MEEPSDSVPSAVPIEPPQDVEKFNASDVKHEAASSAISPVPPKTPASECVKVVVRCRPMTQKEIRDGHVRIIEMDTARGVVELMQLTNGSGSSMSTSSFKASMSDISAPTMKKTFTFDAVYDWNSKQMDLYDETARPLVDSVLEGFNCTIFAYGQTGTGKTFTMEGVRSDAELKGIIPNAYDHIFKHIARSTNQQYLVRSSYLEIYQEEMRDLLAKDQSKRLELKERADIGIYVKDLSSFVCKSVNEIEHVMTIGNQNRAVGATNMNEHSSRSHAIFIITVEHSEMSSIDNQVHIRVGKLNLVDLAGSERQVKTGAIGQRQKEAIKINLSLSALGNVISALVDGKSTHIPYRDSKLTRLLQDSLGGNSKTIMVANVGPASYNYEETLTTLRYASRAKKIRNKPRVNEDPKDALLREFQSEIERLKSLLEEKKRRRPEMTSSVEMTPAAATNAQAIDVEAVANLDAKIKKMESKLLIGGKNIIDHTNEQELQLQRKREEMATQKVREREMLRELEEKEENESGVRETYTSLQQEVEMKKRKLKKIYNKLQRVKSKIYDAYEMNAKERRQLEEIQSDLLIDLKLKYLIIDTFIPREDKTSLLARLTYDDDEDEWKLLDSASSCGLSKLLRSRPVTTSKSSTGAIRKPMSAYAKIAATVGPAYRYKSDDILDLDLILLPKLTKDFTSPVYDAKVKAVLDDIFTPDPEEVIDARTIDATTKQQQQHDFKITFDKVTGRPKTAGSVRKTAHQVPSSSAASSSSSHLNDSSNDENSSSHADSANYFPSSRGLVRRR